MWKWGDVDLSSGSGVPFCGEAVSHRGLSQNQNRSIFFLPSLKYFFPAATGLLFKVEAAGKHAEMHRRSILNVDGDRKLGSFSATWSSSKHSRNKRLIYLNCNTSVLAAVPAGSGKCKVPWSHFKYWKIMFFFFFLNRLTSGRGCTFPLLISTQTCCSTV